MIRRMTLPAALCLALFAAGCMTRQDPEADASGVSGVNLGLYQSRHEKGLGLVRLIPIFTYRYDTPNDAHSTVIWPLLSGGGRLKERDGRHTSQVAVIPLLSSHTWGRDGDEYWSMFSNLIFTRLTVDVTDPTGLRLLSSTFAERWFPMWHPLFLGGGIEGRQRLTYTGIRPLFGMTSQRGDNGGSSQFALFPLISTFRADLELARGDDARSVKKSTTVIPFLLARSDRYHDVQPTGVLDTSRHDLLWPLLCSKHVAFTPSGDDAVTSTKSYSRVLPIYSKQTEPELDRFTFWPLLLRWERTPEGRFFRPLLFMKFKTGE